MTDYMPCYRLDLRDWLDTIERKPDARHGVSQCSDGDVAEKPRPASLRALKNTGAFHEPQQRFESQSGQH